MVFCLKKTFAFFVFLDVYGIKLSVRIRKIRGRLNNECFIWRGSLFLPFNQTLNNREHHVSEESGNDTHNAKNDTLNKKLRTRRHNFSKLCVSLQ